jgi:hypothetical protein
LNCGSYAILTLLIAVEFLTSDPTAGLLSMDFVAVRIEASDLVAWVMTTPVF